MNREDDASEVDMEERDEADRFQINCDGMNMRVTVVEI
jgi:hypothetical protein